MNPQAKAMSVTGRWAAPASRGPHGPGDHPAGKLARLRLDELGKSAPPAATPTGTLHAEIRDELRAQRRA